MAWSQQIPGADVIEERTELAWRMPMGAVSPLWAVFGAAAGAGVAFWWMTRWTRAVNVEALAGAIAKPVAKAAPVEILAAPEPTADVAPVSPIPAAKAEAEAEVLVAAPIVEDVAETVEDVADDLTRLSGIGPKLSASLAARGVTRFAQIAAWTADELTEIDQALSLKGRAVREAWVAQAKRFAASN
ncbi:MAG TPA: helix-hairpin-helix domain-containing protein [Caulobacteraceae bacterium]|jgi:predicted flap endonuclease-1-like 5' DNA nuclease